MAEASPEWPRDEPRARPERPRLRPPGGVASPRPVPGLRALDRIERHGRDCDLRAVSPRGDRGGPRAGGADLGGETLRSLRATLPRLALRRLQVPPLPRQ